jgi:hypothetical protein
MMNSYVEIQVQSPADGAGLVAQWYVGGERSGQAFPLCNVGELRLDRLLHRGSDGRPRRRDPRHATRAGLQRAQHCWLTRRSKGGAWEVAAYFCAHPQPLYGYAQIRLSGRRGASIRYGG